MIIGHNNICNNDIRDRDRDRRDKATTNNNNSSSGRDVCACDDEKTLMRLMLLIGSAIACNGERSGIRIDGDVAAAAAKPRLAIDGRVWAGERVCVCVWVVWVCALEIIVGNHINIWTQMRLCAMVQFIRDTHNRLVVRVFAIRSICFILLRSDAREVIINAV